jgi:iron complex transport system ATP-binding protein
MQPADIENKALVSAVDLSIGYAKKKEIRVLQRRMELSLFEGDIVCLIGPNGCGKSTLIRTLAGIQQPLEGYVNVKEKNISKVPVAIRSQLLSIVLTEKTVVDHITVEEIVTLGRYASMNWLGSLKEADKNKIQQALDIVRMKELSQKTYGTLSDGEKQRAFIAKALASDAPVMLLDEPTAHLDIANRVEILTLLRNLSREKGHAVLISTHELDLALQLADEIWLMMPEGIMHIGTPEEIMHAGWLDKAFGNETLFFDPTPGTFAIRRKALNRVSLEGEGEKYRITELALRRLGFAVGKAGEGTVHVIVEKDIWKLKHAETEYTGSDLSKLCRLLKRIQNTPAGQV